VQAQIEAFRAFTITPQFQEKYGYPALTPAIKAHLRPQRGTNLQSRPLRAPMCGDQHVVRVRVPTREDESMSDRVPRVLLLGGMLLVGCRGAVISKGGTNVVLSETDAGSSRAPACGSTPVRIVDFDALAAGHPVGGISAGTPLAVDSTSVYFVWGDDLMRVPVGGGSVATLASLPGGPSNVSQGIEPVVTSASVVFHYIAGDGTYEDIVSVPIPGGSARTLATSSGRVFGFGVGGANVYFIDAAGTKSVPIAGGDVRLLTSQVTSSGASGLAVVGSHLVVTEGSLGAVVAVPVEGGPPTTLATEQPNADYPMACGSDTCWWTGATPAGIGTPGPGQIARAAPDGTVTMIEGAPFAPWSLTFDGSSFFEAVGCDVCPGSIVRIPLSGTPVPMMSGGFVAVDDECAYVSSIAPFPPVDAGSGPGIFRVSKSFATCCTRDGVCMASTGSCPVSADAGSPDGAQ
jgi:hypothetical protein